MGSCKHWALCANLSKTGDKKMKSQERNDIYAMGPLQVSFSFRVELPTDSLCHVFVSLMVFASCFQVPMWLSCSPMGAQPLGFATLQLFRVYPWQAYDPCGNGLWPTPGVK